MASPVLTENNILDAVYALYEGDATGWTTTTDEYLAGRIYANAAVNRWEFYESTNWRELWTKLTDAADGDTTLTAGTSSYDTPTDFIKLSSHVRTLDASGNPTFWEVVPVSKVPSLVGDISRKYCYLTGNIKGGFDLNFNSKITLTTDHTIEYEYYKAATQFTAITDTTEMTDPYFIVYFVLSRFYENDNESGKASKAFQEAEARLENMRTNNIIGLEGVSDVIESTLGDLEGFGT